MATHSSILAWRIPWTEEPGRLPSMGSQVGHNLVTEPPPPPKAVIPLVQTRAAQKLKRKI